MTASSSTSSCSIGEKSHMKQFIIAVQEYNKVKSEETASILSRKLQLLGVSLDINTFNPNSNIVAEFFVSLHELMSNLDSRSPLVWFSVAVLQQACRNQSAHKALTHTYQFLPILSRLLGDHLTRDKKRKLLTLMQDLTYGIQISWQISYLPHLLTTLTRWIESGDEGITSLSLGVLLNVCHQNLPVIYTLMRTINTKHFLRMVMAMKNPATEVQVCKLLIILEHINGEVPKEDILNFVRVTFRTIVEAFECKDLIQLRHIVEFFLEVRSQKNRVEAVLMYDRYYDDVLRILTAVENNITAGKQGDSLDQVNLESMALLFEFLHSLIELQIPSLKVLHAKMVNMTLSWVQTEVVCSKALALLRSIVVQPEEAQLQQVILEPLASGLGVLLHIVDATVPSGVQLGGLGDQCQKLTALLQLLRALVRNDALQSRVLATLKQNSITGIFDALLGDDEFSGGQPRLQESFSSELNEMYVHAIALVCTLATYSEQWEVVLTHIFTQKQLYAVLAHAFYASSQPDTKVLIFDIAKARGFPVGDVVRVMCEVQMATGNIQQPSVHSISGRSFGDGLYGIGPPLMSGAQVEQLDRVIGRLSEALNNNELQSVATSEVMELYEYKMAAIGHAERAAQASLEAANQHSMHMQHRLAQMSAEVSRLHQLLFHAQQCQEEARRQLRVCENNAAALTARLTKEQVRNKELSEQLSERERCIEEQQSNIQILDSKLSETVQSRNYFNKKYEDQVNKNIALVKASSGIENNLHVLKTTLDEKNVALTRSTQQMETLNIQVRELEEIRKQQIETLTVREKELAETNKELVDKRKILETITKLTKT